MKFAWSSQLRWPSAMVVVCFASTGAVHTDTYAQPADSTNLRLTRELRSIKHIEALESVAISRTKQSMSERPSPLPRGRPYCPSAQVAIDAPLTFGDVLQVILCQSPRMGQALASITERHAGVILAEQSLRPQTTFSADATFSQAPATTLLAASRGRSLGAGVALNWVLFDFGSGAASVRAARNELVAATANLSATHIAQMNEAMRLYVEALTAHARASSLELAEATASKSVEIAAARHSLQVGSLADKLQAEAALAQIRFERTRAMGQARTANGNLAVALGLPFRRAITLTLLDDPINSGYTPSPFSELDPLQIEHIVVELKRDHPRLRALHAEIVALQDRIEQGKAESRGIISLNSSAALSRGLGGTSGHELDRNLNFGIQASIPIFDGARTNARETQIAAQIAQRQGAKTLTEREIEAEVWQLGQQVIDEAQNLAAANVSLTAAEQGQAASLARYEAGVGSILELLSAQQARNQAILQQDLVKIALIQARFRFALYLPAKP